MHQRIKELRKHLGLTQPEFADRIHVERSSIAGYENGKRAPRDATIELICREFGVNETWLRTGEGEMVTVSTRDAELAAFMGRVLADWPGSIRRRMIYALSRLDESGWEVIDRMVTLMAEEKKKPEE